MKQLLKCATKKYGLYIIVVAVFILTFMVNYHVRLYGDDFHYKQFTSLDFSYYVSRNIEHYYRANGRVIVHLLATFFLGLPHVCWAVFNSLLLTAIVFFGSLIVGHNSKTHIFYAGTIFAISILFLHPFLSRQSVYWLTGSFNYVYPVAVFLIYWYLLKRLVYEGKYRIMVLVAAFFAAASVEQVGMMAFGLTLLTVIEKFIIKKEKLDRVLVIALILTITGLASVILSPAVAYRASIEDAPAVGFLNLLRYNIKYQGTTFLFSDIMAPYQIMAMLGSLGVVFTLHKKVESGILKKLNFIVLTIGSTAFLCWFWQFVLHDEDFYKLIDIKHLFFYMFIGFGYILLLIFAAVLVYIMGEKRSPVPLLALILGFGSQIMMLVSPVYGYRNLLCCIIMLAVFTAYILPNLHGTYIISAICCVVCFIYNVPLLVFFPIAGVVLQLYQSDFTFLIKGSSAHKVLIALTYSTILIVCSITYIGTLKGYANNSVGYDYNIEVIEKFKKSGSNEIIQMKLYDDLYGWAMPYHNPYYDPYYKLTFGLGHEVSIIWENTR